MTVCTHGSDYLVDYGPELGLLCELCVYPGTRDALQAWLGNAGWCCPVCGTAATAAKQLVVHHDHFPEALWSLTATIEPRPDLATFVDTRICGACNSLDSIAKAKIPKLPRWFSLSPDDMRRIRQPDGLPDLDLVRVVWEERRTGVIAEQCRWLWAQGMPKEDIRAALATYRTAGYEKAKRRQKLAEATADLAGRDPSFKALFSRLGNAVELIKIALQDGWDKIQCHALIQHYHNCHGDSRLIQRPDEFGPEQYKDWVILEANGDPSAAEFRRRCRFWRERATGTDKWRS